MITEEQSRAYDQLMENIRKHNEEWMASLTEEEKKKWAWFNSIAELVEDGFFG